MTETFCFTESSTSGIASTATTIRAYGMATWSRVRGAEAVLLDGVAVPQ